MTGKLKGSSEYTFLFTCLTYDLYLILFGLIDDYMNLTELNTKLALICTRLHLIAMGDICSPHGYFTMIF